MAMLSFIVCPLSLNQNLGEEILILGFWNALLLLRDPCQTEITLQNLRRKKQAFYYASLAIRLLLFICQPAGMLRPRIFARLSQLPTFIQQTKIYFYFSSPHWRNLEEKDCPKSWTWSWLMMSSYFQTDKCVTVNSRNSTRSHVQVRAVPDICTAVISCTSN